MSSMNKFSEEVRLAKVADTSVLIADKAVLLFLTSPLNSFRALPLELDREISESKESCICPIVSSMWYDDWDCDVGREMLLRAFIAGVADVDVATVADVVVGRLSSREEEEPRGSRVRIKGLLATLPVD